MEEMMVLTDTLEAARSDRGGLGLRPTEILAKSQSGPYGKIQVLSQNNI